MEEQKLTTITGGQIGVFDPDAQLDIAIRAAKALSRVIAQKKKPVIINGEQYLEFEDWMTLGQFDGVSVRTGEAEPVEINGVQGAKAKAFLYNNRTGELIGGAEAYCMRDEEKWGTRAKYEWQGEGDRRRRVKVGEEVVPWFQLASMAQTRAGSKAFRNKEAWVAVLAGYRPTPAEEMTEGTVSNATEERRTIDRSQHYCPIHEVPFFKKGRMRDYAHPIEGTDEWCNEVDSDKTKEKVEASPDELKPAQVAGKIEEHPEDAEQDVKDLWPKDKALPVKEFINMYWLKESLEILQGKGIRAYSDAMVLKYLNAITKEKCKDIPEAVEKLNQKQAEDFVERIKGALEMA